MTTYIPAGPQTRVNGARSGSQSVTSSAALEDGGYVVVWVSLPGTGYLFKGQRYDSSGNAVGSEFEVASLPSSNQSSFTATTGLQDGGFVVAWENGSSTADGSGSAVQAQRFDATGQPVGSAFVVNELTAGNQNGVSLTSLADGSFVATWTTNQPASGGTLSEVKGRLFDSSGTALGSEFLVNTTVVGSQGVSSLVAIQTGGFLATWISGSGSSGILLGQFFDSAGAKLGGEIALAGAGPGYPLEPSVTELADGRIVVAWRNAPDSGSGQTVNGRIFDSSGAPLGSEFLISNPGGNPQVGSPQVKALPDGGFVATWSHPGGTDVSTAVWARIYDTAGTPGTSFLVNTAATLFESGSRTLVTNAGDIVVAWSTSFDVINTDVSARFIALNQAPVIQSDGGGATAAFTVAKDQRVVTQVVAADLVGPAPVAYSISGGADSALFEIDSTTGHLTFVTAPDADAPADADLDGVYEVVVSAGDGELSDIQALSVTVGATGRGLIIASAGQVSALENASAVTRVSATDAAATFAVTGGADGAQFSIDPATGLLGFVAAADFEAPADLGADNVYDVEVTASAAGQSVVQSLSVTVRNVNEAPAFTTAASLSINENSNNVVVAALDSDGDPLIYAIVGGADSGKLSINSATGVLSFYTAPNFEAPGDSGANGVYDVVIRAADGDLAVTQAVSITIANVNEGAVISSNGGGATGTVTVAENQLLATTVTARDNPAGTNITYAISGGWDSSKFTIDAQTGALSFVNTPNFEAPADSGLNNVYDVVVSATDGTVTDTQALAITVSNVNEPFTITPATYSAAEGSLPGFLIPTNEQDSGSLIFTIVGGADAARFKILPTSGKNGGFSFLNISNFEAPTDSDGDNVYEVIIQGSDGTYSDTRTMLVTVTDVQEAVSIISNNGVSSAFLNMAENQAAVMTFAAIDPDNGTVSWSLSGGPDASKFAIDSVTGALTFLAAPDYEVPTDSGANRIYDVIVRASDGVTNDTQALAITITNVIEPFAITSHGGGATGSVSVFEGYGSFQVTTNEAANLTYSLSGADAARFTIVTGTGGNRTINFVTQPNFEAPADSNGDNVYDVIVTVSGGGHGDSQALAVSVANVNEAPVIASNGGGTTASVSKPENGTSVTTVAASDPENAALAYSISGGADAAKFTIGSTTGILAFVTAPDFEAPSDSGANGVYDVVVQVSDGTLVDTQSIAVTVTNVDEGGPVITSNGGGASASVSVVENGSAVTIVAATATPPSNGPIVYAIAGGADSAKFTIDSTTGALAFVSAPNFEVKADVGANGIYDVIVRASDGVNSDTQAIAVTVTNINEAPTITSGGGGDTASYAFGENLVGGMAIAASDPENTARTYSIAGGADSSKFTINATTGLLQFIVAPNYELPTDSGANNVYDVIVRASDGVFSDTQAVSVTIANVNEAPVISSNGAGATASISVAENMTAVATVAATDDENNPVTYSISGGADSSKFTINASTGVLAFVAAPNFEAKTDSGANGIYDVIVRASDGTSADTQAIAVTVTNVNEAPVITSNGGGATATVNQNENYDYATTVASTDPENTTRTYSIVGGADAAWFSISFTGWLAFVTLPDFENPGDAGANNIYDVIVQASDGALADTQAIAVKIFDFNEAPVITSNGGGNSANISFTENGSVVATVTSTDPENTARTYSLAGGLDASKFTIDPSSGVLSFLSAPNFESPTDSNGDNLYYVLVRASDGLLNDVQTLAVTVTDQDESVAITSNGGGSTAGLGVDENGLAVTQLQAASAAGTIAYAIAGGADSALFEIDPVTGELSFIAAPDYEAPADTDLDNVYQVTVSAGNGYSADLQALSVSVGDLFEDGGEEALLVFEPMPRGYYLPSPLMAEHFL